LTASAVLGEFAENHARARSAYIAFVEAGRAAPRIWDALRQQIYLGNDQFIERLHEMAPSPDEPSEVPRIQRRRIQPLDWYRSQYKDRTRAMVEAYRSGNYSLALIAKHFGVHYSTVSRAAKADNNEVR
jgi:hypothetical protein